MRLRGLAELLVFVLAVLLLAGLWFGSCLAVSDSQRQSDVCEAACAPSRAVTPIVGGQEACLCDRGNGAWQRVTPPAEKN